MAWMAANMGSVLSVLSMLLGVAVAISQLAHKANVASQLQSLQKIIDDLRNPPKSS